MTESSNFILAGVMGWPIAHSRSPLIHGHWIEHYQLRGAYMPLAVDPTHLEQALRALPVLGFAGCNLTVPHKVQAMRILDEIDEVARQIGAVNTVKVRADGSLWGTNTDAYGYRHSLYQAAPQWSADDGRPALVIGAGGAAQAVVWALLDAGVRQVRLVNRSTHKAQSLAHQYPDRVTIWDWSQMAAAMEDVSLLTNTTVLGMTGQPALEIALDTLPRTAVVCDIVYVPLETPLLRQARARGNSCVGGLGMLLHQARPAFAHWFGPLPEVDAALTERVLKSF